MFLTTNVNTDFVQPQFGCSAFCKKRPCKNVPCFSRDVLLYGFWPVTLMYLKYVMTVEENWLCVSLFFIVHRWTSDPWLRRKAAIGRNGLIRRTADPLFISRWTETERQALSGSCSYVEMQPNQSAQADSRPCAGIERRPQTLSGHADLFLNWSWIFFLQTSDCWVTETC
jgi:hypothetical protein